MKTCAVSFGDGRHADYAATVVKRFEKLNDVEGRILSLDALPQKLSHPTWAKAWIWSAVPSDIERVIWLDTDVVPVRPIMDIVPNFEIPFCAVEDIDISRQEAEWDNERMCAVRTYFNAGVFVAHRSTEEMFRAWQKEALSGTKHQFKDQTVLNLLVHEYFTEGQCFKLPKECNWLPAMGIIPKNVRMVHFAGWPDHVRDPLLQLLALLESTPVQGGRIERGAACVENW